LLLQVALLLMLGRLIWTWWRADKAAAMAKLSPRQLADAYGRMRNEGVSDVNADDLAAVSEEKEIFANRKR
jgi:hypothetical protein